MRIFAFIRVIPETADNVRDNIFALVNLDADLYQPTKQHWNSSIQVIAGGLFSFMIITISGKELKKPWMSLSGIS